MKNAILINLPLTITTVPPAGLAAISPVFLQNGFSVGVKDVNLDMHTAAELEKIYDAFTNWCELTGELTTEQLEIIDSWTDQYIDQLPNAEVYAVSVFSIYSINYSYLFLKKLKNKFKTSTILVGGSGVSSNLGKLTQFKAYGELLLDQTLATHVIFGEGEHALSKLLNNLPYPGIDHNNPVQIDDLDSLLSPNFDSIDFTRYLSKRLLITGSRGCVRSCTFCDIENTWPKFKNRSPENVLEEMINHKLKYNITHFEFTDSLINGSISSWIKFNDLLANAKEKDRDLKDVTYSGQFICREEKSHPKEMYKLMHYAGVNQLTVGVESFSERIRFDMKKKFTNAAIDYHLDQCAYWGIPNIFLMLVGYPGENLKDHQEAIDSLHKYKKFSDMGIIAMIRWGLTMHIYKDTNLFKNKDSLKLLLDNNIELDGFYTWISSLDPNLDFIERVRRRVELHEVSYNLGYCQPNTSSELASITNLLESYDPQKFKKIFRLQGITQ